MDENQLSTNQKLLGISSLLSQAWAILTQKLSFFLLISLILAVTTLSGIYSKHVTVNRQDNNVAISTQSEWGINSDALNYDYSSNKNQRVVTYPAWLTVLTPTADQHVEEWLRDNRLPSSAELGLVALLALIALAALAIYGLIRSAISLIILDQVSNIQGTHQWASSLNIKRIIKYIWTVILQGLLIGLGFICLIVPGVILAVWFSQTRFVFVNENLSGMAALRRSREYVKGYWWQVVGRSIAGNIVVAIATGILGALLAVIAVPGALLHQPYLTILAAIAGGLIGGLGQIYSEAYLYSLYATLREAKGVVVREE
jgi:hypothetical protein